MAWERRPPRKGIETSERIYTAEEREFMRACDDYRREIGRKFLAASDVLHVLLSLGYRKVAEPMTVREARIQHSIESA